MALSPGGWFILAETDGDIFTNSLANDVVVYTSEPDQRLLIGPGIGQDSVITVQTQYMQVNGVMDVLGDITNSLNYSINIIGVNITDSNVFGESAVFNTQLLVPYLSNVEQLYANYGEITSLTANAVLNKELQSDFASVVSLSNQEAAIENAHINTLSNGIMMTSLILADDAYVQNEIIVPHITASDITLSNIDIRGTMAATNMHVDNLSASNTILENTDILIASIALANMDAVAISNLTADAAQFLDVATLTLNVEQSYMSNVDMYVMSASNATMEIASITNLGVETANFTEAHVNVGNFNTLVASNAILLEGAIGVLSNTSADIEHATITTLSNIHGTTQLFDVTDTLSVYNLSNTYAVISEASVDILHGVSVSSTTGEFSNIAIEHAVIATGDVQTLFTDTSAHSNLYSTIAQLDTLTSATVNITSLLTAQTTASCNLTTNIATACNWTVSGIARIATASNAMVATSNLYASNADLDNVSIAMSRIGTLSNNTISSSNAHIINSFSVTSCNTSMYSTLGAIQTLFAYNLSASNVSINAVNLSNASASNLTAANSVFTRMTASNMALSNAFIGTLSNNNAAFSNVYLRQSRTDNATTTNAWTTALTACNILASNSTVVSVVSSNVHTSNIISGSIVTNQLQCSNVAYMHTISNVNLATSNLYAAVGIFDSINVPLDINSAFARIGTISNLTLSTSNIMIHNTLRSSSNGGFVLDAPANKISALFLDGSNVAVSNLMVKEGYIQREWVDFYYGRSNMVIRSSNLPNAPLDVYGGAAVYNSNGNFPWQHIWTTHEGSNARIRVGGLPTSNQGLEIAVGTGKTGALGGQTYQSCAWFMPSGKVGIGMSNPSSTLTIGGNSLTTGVAANQKVSSPLQYGLIAHYVFDEASGSNFFDHSRSGNDATGSNFFARSPQIYGKSLFIISSASYIRMQTPTPPLSTATMALWYYYHPANTQQFSVLLSSFSGYTHSHLTIENDPLMSYGRLGFTRNTSFIPFGYVIQRDNWYHITLKVVGLDCHVYINGSLVSTVSNYLDMSVYRLQFIGNDQSSGFSAIGMYSDIRIYDRVLSDNEITALVNAVGTSLTLPSWESDRKIVLFDSGCNDSFQFFGMGVVNNQLRYKIPGLSNSAHVFTVSTSSNDAQELVRISSNVPLDLSGSGDSRRKIVLKEGSNNVHQFMGIGACNTTINYHVQSATASHMHVFYAGQTLSNSRELLRIQGDGKIGVGKSNPTFEVDVNGDINFSGNLYKNGILYQGAGTGNTTFFTSLVGINTFTPAYNLDVNGTLGATTATISNLIVPTSMTGPQCTTRTLSTSNAVVQSNLSASNITACNMTLRQITILGAGSNGIIADASGVKYAALPTISNDKIADRTIQPQKLASNQSLIGTTTTWSIVPASNDMFDLGTSNTRFRDLWLGGNSLYIGSTVIQSTSSNGLVFTDTASQSLQRITVNEILIGTSSNSSSGTLLRTDNTGALQFFQANVDANGNVSDVIPQANLTLCNIYSTSNKIGVGITDPLNTLHVFGEIGISNDQGNAVMFSQGDTLTVNNDILILGDIYQGGVKWVSSQWDTESNATVGPSNLSFAKGYIGVGRSNPLAQLHVAGNSILDGSVSLNRGLRLRKNSAFYSSTWGTDSNLYEGQENLTISMTGSNPGNAIKFYSGLREIARITGDSKVGINIQNPAATLHVNGDAIIASNLDVYGTILAKGAPITPSPWGQDVNGDIHYGGRVSIGRSNADPSTKLHVSGNAMIDGRLTFNSVSGLIPFVTLYSSANGLGVNNANPQYRLDVGGSFRAQSINVNGVNIVRTDGTLEAGIVGPNQIIDGAIVSSKIASNAIQRTHLAASIVASNQIADSNITSSKYAPGSVTTIALSNSSVTSVILASNAVSGSTHILDNSIIASKYALESVNTTALSNACVTSIKVAASAINASHIQDRSIVASKIAFQSITSNEIALGTLTAAAISAGSISTALLANGSVTSSKIATGAVTTAALSNAAVGSSQIANNSIQSWHISSNAITASAISTGAVTSTKIAVGAVTTSAIFNGAVTSDKIAPGAVSSNAIAPGTITSNLIAPYAISGCNLAFDSVQTIHIANASVTSDKLAPDAISVNNIGDASILGTKIALYTLTNSNIAPMTIDTISLSNASVTGSKLANGAVTSTKIASNAVQTTHIGDLQIIGSKLANASITSTKLSAGSVTTNALQDGSVQGNKIADNGITSPLKLGAGVVNSNAIRDFTIINTKYAPASIDNTKFVQGAVDNNALGTASVTSAKIMDSNIGSQKLRPNLTLIGSTIVNNTLITTQPTGEMSLGWLGHTGASYALAQNNTYGTMLNAAADQQVNVRIGNVDALTVDTTRFVGMGTTTPLDAVHIRQDSNVAMRLDAPNGSSSLRLMPGVNQTSSIQLWNGSTRVWALGNRMDASDTSDMLKLHNGVGSNVMRIEQNGNLSIIGTFAQASDSNLKMAFEPITNAIEKINSLSGYTFSRRTARNPKVRYAGLIAQQVQSVLPEAVRTDGEYLALDYSGMGGLYVEAIKELSSKLDRLIEKLGVTL
jgi:hypothetical protein